MTYLGTSLDSSDSMLGGSESDRLSITLKTGLLGCCVKNIAIVFLYEVYRLEKVSMYVINTIMDSIISSF